MPIARRHGRAFPGQYGKTVRSFIYNSKALHNLESFSSDAGINVMIINVQAFNARGKDARRIYEELDDFQSRRPIDVIARNRPILILDEPQKMEGARTVESMKEFNPLLILRYSATHKQEHNKVYRLDALDAYNQKLVKKIAVRGITVKGQAGTNAYLYLQSIEVSTDKPPEARVEMEIRQIMRHQAGYCACWARVTTCTTKSGELDQYKGFVVADINANRRHAELHQWRGADRRRCHGRRERDRAAPDSDPRGNQGALRKGAAVLFAKASRC